METIRQYLLSVISAAIICSVIISLTDKKASAGTMIRMLCGLFMSVTMIYPLVDLKARDITSYFQSIEQESEHIVSDGKIAANEAVSTIIKERTEAYILDKASSAGLTLTVSVCVEGEEIPSPVSVTLQGKVSPYAQQKLCKLIEDELGIPKERQKWI